MKIKVQNKKIDFIITPIITIILGIFLIIFKEEALRWSTIILGGVLLVLGLIGLIGDSRRNAPKENITIDAIIIGMSVLLIVFAGWVVFAIRIILGVLFIIYGFIKVLSIFGGTSPTSAFLLSMQALMLIVLGVFLICDKDVLYIVAGILMICDGILGLLYALANRKVVNISAESTSSKKVDAIDAETKVIREEKVDE